MIGSVYDYYLTTYAAKPATKNDIHKKSELRNVYNNIIKISKKSPLYKISVSENIQKYAIDLKENARTLSMDINNLFDKRQNSQKIKKYISDNPNIVQVKNSYFDAGNHYMKTAIKNTSDISDTYNDSNTYEAPENQSDTISAVKYDIEVINLASPQVNTSHYLNNDMLDIPTGTHIFEVNVGNNSYEFRFNANEDENNKIIFEKLSRLINRSNIGLSARMLYSGNNSALEISSDVSTGISYGNVIFSITSDTNTNYSQIVNKLGLNNITSNPSDARFLVNGIENTSSSNTLMINKELEITLNDISKEGESVTISLADDLDSVILSIKDMINSYNNLINLSGNPNEGSNDAIRLNNEISKISDSFSSQLESMGIKIDSDKTLSFDEALFIQVSNEGDLDNILESLDMFKQAISLRADDISINPMKYVDKVMISYPNPLHSFANPYLTSIYTGMMYNGYI